MSRGQCSSWWSSWRWRRILCRKLPVPPVCRSGGRSGGRCCRSRGSCSCTSSWSHPRGWRTEWLRSRPHWRHRSDKPGRHWGGFWWSDNSKQIVAAGWKVERYLSHLGHVVHHRLAGVDDGIPADVWPNSPIKTVDETLPPGNAQVGVQDSSVLRAVSRRLHPGNTWSNPLKSGGREWACLILTTSMGWATEMATLPLVRPATTLSRRASPPVEVWLMPALLNSLFRTRS